MTTERMGKRRLVLALWLATRAAAVPVSAQEGVPQPVITKVDPGGADPTQIVLQQTSLRHEIEDRIQRGILDPVLGKEKATVAVKLQLRFSASSRETETTATGAKDEYKARADSSKIRTQYLVPGVPLPESMLGKQAKPEIAQAKSAAQGRSIERKEFDVAMKFVLEGEGETRIPVLRVTVFHDRTIAQDKLDEAKEQILTLLRVYVPEKEGELNVEIPEDSVLMRPMDYVQFTWLDELKRPETFIPLLFASLLLMFLMYLFGPLNRRLADFVRSLNSKKEAAFELQAKNENMNEEKIESEGEDEGAGGGGLPGLEDLAEEGEETDKVEGEEDEMKKVEYFQFVQPENTNRLVYLFLIRREEPWVIATVLSYLKPEVARQVLSVLPVELQAKVAMEALTVRQVTEEQVQAIEADIKENIDYVVGGLSRLLNVLEEADPNTRQNILEHLKNQKPLIYEMVKKAVLTFDEVVNFPDREMQTIVREVKVEDLAKALHNAAPEVVEKFMTNMSKGAAALLKESMEYISDLTPEAVEEERFKIVQQIKELEKANKIKVREQISDDAVVEGLIEDMDEARLRNERARETLGGGVAAFEGGPRPAAAGPAAAPQMTPEMRQYFDAGLQMYQQGQHGEAVSYLQYVVGQDAGNWQAHQYLGAALHALGRGPEASQHFDRAMQLNGDPGVRQWIETVRAGAQA